MNELNLMDGLRDSIKNAIIEVCEQKLNSKNVNITIEHGSKKGDNFAGIVYRLKFQALNFHHENDNKDDTTNTSKMILKVAPLKIARRKTFNSRFVFLREIYMYEEVLSKFYEFQLSKGIDPGKNGFNEYPSCYKAVDTELSECVFLQDLKDDQFEMMEYHTDVVTLEHVRLVMKALGKFHAISFAMKDQQPEQFKSLRSKFTELYMTETFRNLYSSMKNRQIDSVIDNNELVQKLNDLYKMHPLDIGKDCVNGELAEPYSVICHGDFWINNTMVKYDKKRQAVEVKFLDWQYSRYASPVTDLLFFLVCVKNEVRSHHYDDFLKTYHASLSDMLKRLGSDSQKIYPYEAMQGQLRKFGNFALVIGSVLIPFLTTDAGEITDMDEMVDGMQNGTEANSNKMFEFKQSVKSEELYNKEMQALVTDAARLGYI